MSKLCFSKYQGAGNDFLLIDDRSLFFDPRLVSKLCHRQFGVGADGVILLQNSSEADFCMRIFNADGSEAESCGNGLRCFVRFLIDLGLKQSSYRIALHHRSVRAYVLHDQICVEMGAARDLRKQLIDGREIYFVDTGVPHAVLLSATDEISQLGPYLRRHPVFQPAGTNVNLAEICKDGSLFMRTYERGVEAETLSCGTGALAVALIAVRYLHQPSPVRIATLGGKLVIHVEDLELKMVGPAVKVFEGEYLLERPLCLG